MTYLNPKTTRGLDRLIKTFEKVEGFRMSRSQAVDRLLALILDPERFSKGIIVPDVPDAPE